MYYHYYTVNNFDGYYYITKTNILTGSNQLWYADEIKLTDDKLRRSPSVLLTKAWNRQENYHQIIPAPSLIIFFTSLLFMVQT